MSFRIGAEVDKKYYLTHIGKDLICWGIPDGKNLAATGSLCLFNRVPYQENLTGKEGYLFNIYTCSAFRKRGFATEIIKEIIRHAAEMQIKRLWLNSSEHGRQLYARCGFVAKNNEMEHSL